MIVLLFSGLLKIMNVLINSDEWVAPWVKDFAVEHFKNQSLSPSWTQTQQYVKECKTEYQKSGLIVIDFKHVNYLLDKDLREFRNVINSKYKQIFKDTKVETMQKMQDRGVTDEQIIQKYLDSNFRSFAKTIAPQIDSNLTWLIDSSLADWHQPFFIRNVFGNEKILAKCLREKKEFWFVDSGYTNFLYKKQKVWHRLVHNHIHHGPLRRSYPTDRLSLLPSLPATKWRRKGSKILVIESSPSHYQMQGTTLEKWRKRIAHQIRTVSDRPIEFRTKEGSKKDRPTVYELLKETKEYYCVVSDSSAAAVEAIWTGTPVVTLGRHITNSVSKNNLEQINELYRDDLDHWLAMLSYSQFTFDELCDGTALSITKEYHNV